MIILCLFVTLTEPVLARMNRIGFGLIWIEYNVDGWYNIDLVHNERQEVSFQCELNPYYFAGFYMKMLSVQQVTQ